MPCTKCDNGKWKWGENGECKYDSKAACEKANPKHYKNLKTTSIVELVIADESPELTIDAISLVTSPAIEENFVFFGKEKNNLTFAKIDEEKRMVISPALIPNKQIFRHDPNTNSDYYVYFSVDTVRKASELYLKHNNHHSATYQHEEDVKGILTTESWIKTGNQDKSNLYGYDLPIGTWFVTMRIDNDEMWSKIKDGELKGLSIEGYFINKMEKMSKTQPTTEQILSALNEMIKSKTELKTQKIELGITDDIDKLFNSANESAKDFVQTRKKLSDTAADKNKAVNKLNKKAETLRKKFESAAKELGIDIKKSKPYKKIEATIKTLGSIQNAFARMSAKIYQEKP